MWRENMAAFSLLKTGFEEYIGIIKPFLKKIEGTRVSSLEVLSSPVVYWLRKTQFGDAHKMFLD